MEPSLMIALALAVMVSTSQPVGVMEPGVTIEQICKPGYTQTVRPPSSLTTKIKLDSVIAHHLPHPAAYYEGDHAWPIEDGGCPSPIRKLKSGLIVGCTNFQDNFWLQQWAPPPGAHQKDAIENMVHRKLCAGEITIRQAGEMLRHWKDYLPK